MTPDDELDLPRIGSELRVQRLGFARRGLAAELVDERRKVARLCREIADLRARLESLEQTQGGDQAASRVVGSRLGSGARPVEAANCARHV
jgi:hypothetical protein